MSQYISEKKKEETSTETLAQSIRRKAKEAGADAKKTLKDQAQSAIKNAPSQALDALKDYVKRKTGLK